MFPCLDPWAGPRPSTSSCAMTAASGDPLISSVRSKRRARLLGSHRQSRFMCYGTRMPLTSQCVGCPMAVIAKQLGHADTRMTEKHYAHLAPNYVADTIRASFPNLGISETLNVVPLRVAGKTG